MTKKSRDLASPAQQRRAFLRQAGALGAASAPAGNALTASLAASITLPFENGERELVAYP